MTGNDKDPGWLGRRLLDDPGLLAEVLAEAHDETMHGDLRARGVLARQLGFELVRDLSGEEYLLARQMMAGAGKQEAARVMATIPAAAQLLPGASMDWLARYESRPLTRAQRNALDLVSNGRARRDDPGTLVGPDGMPGIDGAWYEAACFRLHADSFYDPAVIITTMAGTVEVVAGFRSAADRDSWLADRMPGVPGPLASVMTNIPSRAVREELVLACLLSRLQLDVTVPQPPGPQLFTSFSRSEIFLAWQQARPGATAAEVAGALDRRLLLAPDWAADDVGIPGQRTAPAYLHRLALTPVTEDQAAAALRDLAEEDADLVSAAPPRPPELTWRRAPYTGPLLQPPASRPGDPGTAPVQRS